VALRAPATCVDGRMLEQQQRVADLVGLAQLAQPQLQLECLRVRDDSELDDP